MTITATPASLSRGKICKKKSQVGEIDALLSTAPTTKILERYAKREGFSKRALYLDDLCGQLPTEGSPNMSHKDHQRASPRYHFRNRYFFAVSHS
jgi:hypothetical protein